MTDRTTLLEYLTAYSHWQPDILLVSRKSSTAGFGNKALFNTTAFDPMEHYNHRNILDNEIVIEFDNPDPTKNGNCAGLVVQKLKNAGIDHSVWSSGGKSVHVHCHFDLAEYKDLKLIKRMIIEALVKDIGCEPDYQLCVRRHLIRAEFGMHEKSGLFKKRIMETVNYPKLAKVPQAIKEAYDIVMTAKSIAPKPKCLNAAHPLVIKVLDSRNIKDGRKQLMWRLINILKQDYNKEQVLFLLYSWYKSNNGKDLSERDIKKLVDYHWNRTYTITEYSFKQVLKDLGIVQ